MTITIVGANTKDGIKLKKHIMEIACEMQEKINIKFVNDTNERELPVLYVDEKLICKGEVPTQRMLTKYIKKINNML